MVRRVAQTVLRAAALLALASGARAQALERVVVIAAPPDPVGAAAFSVVHLDAAAISAAPQLDVALAQVPGLSLFRRNSSLSANPTTQGVSLRAIAPSGAGRALVTLDGVPQNDPFGGWVIWSALPPEAIASADVVRGAGAGPYGAGALTGVIALREASSPRANISGGSLGQRRVAAAGGVDWGKLSLYASAQEVASDGWIPVSAAQRGAADSKLTLDARSISLRAEVEPDAGTLIAARVAAYREARHSGIVDTHSEADGIVASLTVAHPEHGGDLGWWLHAWLHQSGFAQNSASIAPGRMTATPSNDQYATPALGWGANAALRGSGSLDWEIGGDLRLARGNAKEHAAYISGAFTQGRISGGKTFVGGLYAEAARHADDWLFTLGVRADAWSSFDGHVQTTDLASSSVLSDYRSASRSGVLPTARAGLRRDYGGWYLRAAAYEGFRAPSLNELYRPFRLGNNVTAANPALSPEQLFGVEIGAGGNAGAFAWDVTLFFNQLHAAITNVTIGVGPMTYPGAGFVPAGGLLIQRQNAGNIDAPGVEGNIAYACDALTLRAAFALLDQRVHGGPSQLSGKSPSQAPRATITAGADLALPYDLTLSTTVRFESNRWADDANTLRLGAATTAGARLSWAMTENISLYLAADNLFDARLATTESADGVYSIDAPRIVSAGLTVTD